MSTNTQSLISEAEAALSSTVSISHDALVKADKEYKKETSALQSTLENILGGKTFFWVEKDVDGVRLANNMLGWATFGLSVHAWHRGIQKKPILSRPLRPYAIAFPVWALLGYYIHHFELRQEEIIAQRRMILRRNRGLLTEKDLEEVQISNAYKDAHEKRAKMIIPPSGQRPPSTESEMAKKVRGLASGEMEVYGKRLNEKLEQFEREFEKQGKGVNPVVSSSDSWVRYSYATPKEARDAYAHGAFPSTESSTAPSTESKSWFGSLWGKKRSPEQVEELKRWEAEQERQAKERVESFPAEVQDLMKDEWNKHVRSNKPKSN